MENNIILISLEKEELSDLIKQAVQSEFVRKKQKDLLNTREVCELLGISPSTLSKWKNQNKIPFKRLGKRIFFLRNEVMEALSDSYYSKLKEFEYENL